MRTLSKHTLTLAILILAAGAGFVDEARADLRVDATLRAPGIRIRIGDGPQGARGQIRVRHDGRIQVPRHVNHLDRRDRRIACRLADYTGASKRELLQLRRDGYRWVEIGRWLQLPRHVVRASFDKDSWNDFLRYERRGRRGDRDRRGWRVDGCYDR